MDKTKKYVCVADDGRFGYAAYSEIPDCMYFKYWGKTLRAGADLRSGVVVAVMNVWIGRHTEIVKGYTLGGEWTDADERKFQQEGRALREMLDSGANGSQMTLF
ncbi:hypothetical protein [Staphylococcus aureus]|uniref:hypothetical protein n=1 Tax=Staphylococcus aureus TaxID=1280 RepID=UPI0020BF6946|nr:hypothetical protein [Staphylococcus aureus]